MLFTNAAAKISIHRNRASNRTFLVSPRAVRDGVGAVQDKDQVNISPAVCS